jgi:dihydroxy-acid dehydratase
MSTLRSAAVTAGVQRAPNRAMLRAVGFGDGDFDKPIIGIANGYSTITPCNAGLDVLARRAEAAVRAAGAMPQIFGTITVSDGISMGTEGMKYSLVSREVIADSIETACGAESMDGVVAVGGCDKNMPGAMIAIARMNIPAIFVYGGTIKPGGAMILDCFGEVLEECRTLGDDVVAALSIRANANWLPAPPTSAHGGRNSTGR